MGNIPLKRGRRSHSKPVGTPKSDPNEIISYDEFAERMRHQGMDWLNYGPTSRKTNEEVAGLTNMSLVKADVHVDADSPRNTYYPVAHSTAVAAAV